jgi:hypothetical protein
MTVALIQQLILATALIHKASVVCTCDLEILGDRLRETWGLFLPSLVVLVSWLFDAGEPLEELHKVDACLQTLFLLRALTFLAQSGQLLNVLRTYSQLAIHCN